MTSDEKRRLLELAAKAAGYSAKWCDYAGMDIRVGYQGGMFCDDGEHSFYWCPIDDDGDALRLAVKLCMVIDTKRAGGWPVCASADNVPWVEEQPGNDPYAATRLAIVRAAAAIGEAMK